jgi:hypothetical protein
MAAGFPVPKPHVQFLPRNKPIGDQIGRERDSVNVTVDLTLIARLRTFHEILTATVTGAKPAPACKAVQNESTPLLA